MKLNKKKRGFTLIELMAVIAILAILAAVLVPTVTGYINRSKKSAVITQVRTVMNAVATYDLTATDKINDELGTIKASTAKISELADVNGLLGTDSLLTTNDITKLTTNMTVAQAKAINEDEEAINNIIVDSNGKITKHGNVTIN